MRCYCHLGSFSFASISQMLMAVKMFFCACDSKTFKINNISFILSCRYYLLSNWLTFTWQNAEWGHLAVMATGLISPIKMLLSCRMKTLGRFFFLVVLLVFYCEFLHYYLVLLRCTWPSPATLTWARFQTEEDRPQPPLRVMILSDTHLLGFKNGHWFDKLRR